MSAWFGGWREVPLVQMGALRGELHGPALVVEPHSTLVLEEGWCARALAAINEGKMSYPDGDRICLAKDNPVVIPDAQRCGKVLVISWSEGPHKTYTINYASD